MKKNNFFIATKMHKEFLILDFMHNNEYVSQRLLSHELEISLAMINHYINTFMENGYINKVKIESNLFHYQITKSGIKRMNLLNLDYLKATQVLYFDATINLINFFNKIVALGFKKILLYGAGEVAEIIIQTINIQNIKDLEIVAIIDDLPSKQNSMFGGVPVISKNEIDLFNHDGVLISSFSGSEKIEHSLSLMGYDNRNIIKFF